MKLYVAIAGLGLLLVAACQGPAPRQDVSEVLPELQAEYRELARTSHIYTVAAEASKVRIYVFRGGTAARLGHNHVLSAPRFEGYVSLPSEQVTDASFELRMPLADLVVDDSTIRAETGGNFSSPRSASDIEGTRRNMLGEKGFDAERYPLVRLRSGAIEGEWPFLTAQVEVTLHGVTRVLPVKLRADRQASRMKISGALTLKQSDFGITPFSALGGLMAVQDEVIVTFDLTAKPARFLP